MPKRDRSPRHSVMPSDAIPPRKSRFSPSRSSITPLTTAQKAYMNAINVYDIIFCKGPTGTGKSYVPVAMAADAFQRGEIEKIIVSRPAVEAGESYGYLPGEVQEKWAPYFAPVRQILEQRLGSGQLEAALEYGKIEIAPLGFLRGHTFDRAWVLFDEAQNTTPKQMQLFLTRIGKGSKMIIDGDPEEQSDIPGLSGFDDAWDRMGGHPQIGFVEFDIDDIVRRDIVRDILLRYREQKGVSVGQAELDSFVSRKAA